MRFTSLAIALLAHTAHLTSAAPIENTPVENATLVPRDGKCSSYPANTPGTFFKRNHLSSKSPCLRNATSPPLEEPDFSLPSDISLPSPYPLLPCATINWCREGSNIWLTFPAPGDYFGTQADYGTLFRMGLQTC